MFSLEINHYMNTLARIFAIILVLSALQFETRADDPVVFISAFTKGEEGALYAYQFDSKSSKLTFLNRTTDVENPFFMALSNDGKFLYSIHALAFGGKENEEVAAYRLDGRSGKLNLLNRQTASGTASCYLEVDATGKSLLVANYSSGDVASLLIGEDGKLGETVSYFKHEGKTPTQKNTNAHCVIVSPDNQFAFVADLGIDKILIYRFHAATAKLTVHSPSSIDLPSESGPRHLTFHPNGKLLYAINEKGNTVSAFSYDRETGVLSDLQIISTIPDSFEGKTYTADLKITPDGKFLYGTNRGHDSIASYRIEKDGKLTLIKIEPSLGKGPQNLAITPDGKHLFCANMPSNNVVVFKIDSRSGELTAVGEPVEIPKPSCIKILP